MLDAFRPAHLANVDEALNAGLDLHERTVVGHADDFSVHASADREALRYRRPRIGKQLLAPQRNALLILVELQNLNLYLFAGLHDRRGVRHAPPNQIANMKESIHPAEVDEDAIISDVLYSPGHYGALRER